MMTKDFYLNINNIKNSKISNIIQQNRIYVVVLL